MITKGYLLNVCRDERVKSVLAASENLQELEAKIEELKKVNEEKKIRYLNTLNIQEKYYKNYHKEVFIADYFKDFKTKEFVTDNPIPDEIKEFVIYSQDRNIANLYFYSEKDFNVEYWITNILGFR